MNKERIPTTNVANDGPDEPTEAQKIEAAVHNLEAAFEKRKETELLAKGAARAWRPYRINDDGNVVAPDTAGVRLYVDPKDGQIHELEAGKKLPPHARAA